MSFALRIFFCFLLALPLSAEIAEAPQHVVGVGGGCDGNGQCSGDAFFAEKVTGATYSVSYIEFVPSMVQVTVPTQLGTSANQTTATTQTKNVVNIKPIVSTGVEQIVWQSGRNSITIGGTGGAALPSTQQDSVNVALNEHISFITRINKVAHTEPGQSNWYVAVTGYFKQIIGLPNGQTYAVRLNLMHGANGRQN